MERWRRPLTVLDIEAHPAEGILLPDGRVHGQVRVLYDRESTERIREGMACAKCMEPFEEAWPENCPVCGAPIRERQAEYFAREFDVRNITRPSLDEEIAGMHERAEEDKRRRL